MGFDHSAGVPTPGIEISLAPFNPRGRGLEHLSRSHNTHSDKYPPELLTAP